MLNCEYDLRIVASDMFLLVLMMMTMMIIIMVMKTMAMVVIAIMMRSYFHELVSVYCLKVCQWKTMNCNRCQIKGNQGLIPKK